MKVILFILCILSVLSYEKIDIYSDNLSFINVERDDAKDRVTVNSTTRIGLSFKKTVMSHFSLPEGLQEFSLTITNPEQNTGRYILETPYDGVHVALTYQRQQPIEGLCDIFATVFPCFQVKQCNVTNNNPAAVIDLEDVFWTPKSLIPYSIKEPTAIVGDEWVKIAHIVIPKEHVNLDNYHTGHCISSVVHHNHVFEPESAWYPHSENAEMRFVTVTISNKRDQEITIHDSHIVDSPLIIPNKNAVDSFSSSTDVVFHEFSKSGKFERFTANNRKIHYPMREFPFFMGDVTLSLHGEELTIDGLVSARDGTYNPYIPIYDSQMGIAVHMPKGMYIDLAEMRLMYDSGKLPTYVTYVSNVNTDLTYEQSSSQLVVFLIETAIYPLPPTLNFNLTIPVHFRGSTNHDDVNVVLSPPAFFACSPVRDTSIKNSKPIWWQPAFPKCNSLEVTLPKVSGERQKKQDLLCLGLSILCLLILLVEMVRYLLYSIVCNKHPIAIMKCLFLSLKEC